MVVTVAPVAGLGLLGCTPVSLRGVVGVEAELTTAPGGWGARAGARISDMFSGTHDAQGHRRRRDFGRLGIRSNRDDPGR